MTGVIRRTDRLGRLCFPRGMRRLMEIEADTLIEIVLDSDRMLLRKYAPGCSNCATAEVFKSIGGCRKCFEAMTGATLFTTARGVGIDGANIGRGAGLRRRMAGSGTI